MSTTAPATPRSATTPKQQFLDSYQAEADKTLRVLRAYPKDKTELKPHPRAKNARELAFMFVAEQGAIAKTLTDGFDWSAALELASSGTALYPGDVLAAPAAEPIAAAPGDVVEIAIDWIGSLEQRLGS